MATAKKPRPRYYTQITTRGRRKLIKTRARGCRLDLIVWRNRDGSIYRSGVGRLLIGNKWWGLVVVPYPLQGAFGYCEHDLGLIVISNRGSDKDFLDTILHECKHALNPKAKEKTVLREGNVLSEIVTAFGYKN